MGRPGARRVGGRGTGRVSWLQAPAVAGSYWAGCPPFELYPRPLSRRRYLPVLPLLALWAAAVPAFPVQAVAGEADAVFFERAASCVAVLERDAVALAGRYQAGERGVKPALVKLTEQGFSFIGRAYLRGLRKEEADRLTGQAKQAQKTLPAEALAQLSAACQAEGARLYAEAGSLERMLVSNRAKARVDKLLAPKKPK